MKKRLSADTAAVIYSDEELEVIGSGLVVIVDGTSIEYSNVTEINDGEPISIEGLKMHVLGPGKCFRIEERVLKSKRIRKVKKTI